MMRKYVSNIRRAGSDKVIGAWERGTSEEEDLLMLALQIDHSMFEGV
jgi:hypothetical protein